MNTQALTFYTHPMSRGRTVRWMLEECGADYDTVPLDYGTTMKAPGYLAINPMGKVPALTDGDAVLTEVAAILLHLAERFPERHLAPPPGTPERTSYYRWIAFVSGPLETLMSAKSTGHLGEPTSMGYGTEDDVLNTLDDLVGERDFIAGDRFTAADLLLAAYLAFYMQFKMIEPRPNFVRYTELHRSRPASVRADAIDERLLAKQARPG
ncbi:glutathione S-transferase [Lysobacter pythonis]|uniref:Glutathione S-transferase n=1 Tax=Solilutibacter pythonis TaxID=2483112 RepID=A0A3M2HQ57_9GAMM|nr:glutathione S-transferase [Lysobacter pythonis]RMH87884.1 glutathione S-transferase [Lysobacter pythonis]